MKTATELHPNQKPQNPQLKAVCRLAEEYCANWWRGSLCQGADVDLRTGRHFRWRAAGNPCLLGLGLRCPYFEQSVLPMEKRKENAWPTLREGMTFREAAPTYRRLFLPETLVERLERLCPDCGKHPIGPKKRCCEKCRQRRRRESDAVNHRKWRKASPQRHTVTENGSSLGAASQGTISDVRYGLSAHPDFDLKTVGQKEVAK
jgi:hypothetical protein